MNYKTILVAMLIMAMTVGTVSALNPNAITIRDCVQEGVLSPLPTPVDTSRYWLTQNTTGTIDLNEDGSYVFTVNPNLAYYKKGNLYFYDTNGVRHTTSITVYPCMDQTPICDITFFNQDAIVIHTPIVGEPLNVDTYFPGNGAMSSIVTFDGAVSEDRIYRGETCIVVTAYVDGIPYACNGMTL